MVEYFCVSMLADSVERGGLMMLFQLEWDVLIESKWCFGVVKRRALRGRFNDWGHGLGGGGGPKCLFVLLRLNGWRYE